MKTMLKIFTPWMAGLGLACPVQAHIVDLGSIDNAPYAQSIYDASSRRTFTGNVTFQLNEISDMGGSFIQSGAAAMAVTVDSVVDSVVEKRLSPWLAGAGSTFADLAPGVSHTLTVTGTGPALYRNVLKVAAVPEAETGLMIAIGLGLVVFQLRRTQRSLQHRPLAE